MDESTKHQKRNPISQANPVSKLFFWWLNPLFTVGYKRRLESEDLYNVVKEDDSEELGNKLEKEWDKELSKQKHGGKPSLVKALLRMFGLQYLFYGIILFFEEGTKVCQPLLLGRLIRYFTPNSTVSRTDAYLYAMGVSLCAVLLAVAHHPYFFGVQRIGMRMRIACCSLLYRKALRLSNTALGQTTTGQIVNLMSNDVNRFDQAGIFIHFLWVGPLQAIAVIWILWAELGPSTLGGFAVLLLLIPIQAWMGKLFSKLRRKTAIHTDERVKLMNEIISGMRVIKMYCWEKPFGDLVEKVRSSEMKKLCQSGYTRGLILGPFFVSQKMIIFVTFLVFVLGEGGMLTAERVYITVSIYKGIQLSTTLFIPLAVQFLAECRISIDRFKKFLLLGELNPSGQEDKYGLRPKPDDCCVELKNVTAKWDPNLEQYTLNGINTSVAAGNLVAVIGPVGAGKSSLLMSILGELPLIEGNVKVRGKLAYISQQPWVFSASLRQNIIFGNKYEEERYEKILRACALSKDIELMPQGDSTLIGDRGVSLSGGQRARVSLARALYMDADIYLLDDPLSAVDAAVGRHLFNTVIRGMLINKPVILVTHQLQYLKEADHITILKDGEQIGGGTFDELLQSGIDFAALLRPPKEEEEDKKKVRRMESSAPLEINEIGSAMSLGSIEPDFEPETIQLPEQEERREGTVGMSTYVKYFSAGASLFKFTFLVLLNLVAQVSYVMSDWWLSRWSNEEEARHAAIEEDSRLHLIGYNLTNVTIPTVDTYTNVYIFSGIIGGVFVFGLLRALMFFKVAVDASQTLHNRMFSRILRTPITFFDTNPVGRILNRFSKDVGHMDDMLPITFFDFIQCFLLIIGIVIVAGVVNPWVFIPIVPLTVLFLFIRKYYLASSRHIKRLEGTTRSPVFSHLSASLQGLHTIRASGIQEKFTSEFDVHQNLHTETWFLFLATSRWFAVRLDWLCVIFVTTVSFCCVFASESMDAGLVGLSMTYAMTLMGMFQWGVRQSAEVENQMISVERVLEYTNLPSEAPLESEKDKKPPSTWPSKGEIVGDTVCLQYSLDGPLVLKHINFKIRSMEKVGIVGRTGAGKSSLIAMLFRLVEPTGSITIDDIDIKGIGLHDLRNQVSIIPQDPVLFTGSLRKNLDPFCEHNDDSLWKVLGEVQLKEAIADLPGGLEAEVSEGGVNFSVGQRQLICLARAILRKNKILIIDEATANVDPRTDELIQITIREKFYHCTVLTIAHRLNTIMDSDRVLVLDEGRIVEFDSPYHLLKRPDGYFYKMVQQTGAAEATHLMDIAKTSHLTGRHGDKAKDNQHPSGHHGDKTKDNLHLTGHHGNKAKDHPHPTGPHEAKAKDILEVKYTNIPSIDDYGEESTSVKEDGEEEKDSSEKQKLLESEDSDHHVEC
ncbi:hypothetical protein ScPMuIL_018677 [Solemya velum]